MNWIGLYELCDIAPRHPGDNEIDHAHRRAAYYGERCRTYLNMGWFTEAEQLAQIAYRWAEKTGRLAHD